MPLIVEDGSGVIDAESYASVQSITEYATSYGFSEFLQLSEADQEVRARKATQYIETMYRPDRRVKVYEQGLGFPASYCTREFRRVVKATCWLAASGVNLDTVRDVGPYKSRTVRVEGAVQKSEVYRDKPVYPTYPVADALMAPISSKVIGSGMNSVRIEVH